MSVSVAGMFTTKLQRSAAKPQSFNRYSYVQNDPVNHVDPSGLWSMLGCSAQFGSCGGGWDNGGQGYSGHPFDSSTYEYGGGGPTSENIAIGLARYESWLAQQRQETTPTQQGPLSDADCDKKLASIFGGPGAVVGSTRDPSTLDSQANARAYYASAGRPLPANFGERPPGHGPAPYNNPNPNSSDRGGIIHIYGNAQGSAANTGLYAPSGGTVGRMFTTSGGNAQINVSYNSGLTIAFVHVTAASGGPNAMGSVRIGNIGGPGGNNPGYIHSHLVFFNKGVRVDPRKVFCGQ